MAAGCFPTEATTGPAVDPTAECGAPVEGELRDCVVHGSLVYTSPDVLNVVDVEFDGTTGGDFAIDARWGAGPVVIVGCDIHGAYTEAAIRAAAVMTSITDCRVHDLGADADGVKAYTNTTMWGNVIRSGGSGHTDGVQIEAPVAFVTIEGNTIEGGSNAAIMLSPENPSGDGPGPVHITGNLLGCHCDYPVRFYSDDGHTIAGVAASGNVIVEGTSGWLDTNYAGWSWTGNYLCTTEPVCVPQS